MSTDKDNHKSDEMKVDEKGDAKADIKKAEANDVEKEVKDDNEDKSSDNESEPEPEKVKKETPRKTPSKAKETKKEEKSEEEEDENDEKDGDEEDDDDEDDGGEKNKKADTDGKVPLLDQPLQVSGARERKKVERFSVDKSETKEVSAVEIPEGRGTSLGNIGIIENNISKTRVEELKKFHQVLFGRQGKATLIKKNIRKFNGFDFEKGTEQYDRKKTSLAKLDWKYLKEIAVILDLGKEGSREDLATRLLDFLMVPKGAGTAPAPVSTKGALTKGGRPKRSAATKANNKGYSDGSDEDDEDRAPRSRRANKGRRPNLKDESSSEDEKAKDKDEDEDGEDKGDEEKGSDVDMLAEEETPSSDESDDPKSKKKRAPPPKASAKKSKKKSVPAKKEKPTPKKRKAESDEDDEDESSEDDQPLVKKTKTPPTDDDIKTYVKEILEGANLEEITMKTVCKQVYSHYPEFDLAHKKDFIKTTVKSLIST